MRITIVTDEGERVERAPEPVTAAAAEPVEGAAPPAELAARAAAMGAESAGAAPAEASAGAPSTAMGEGEPAPFVAEPGTPETGPEDARSAAGTMSAGGAPEFAAGALDVQEAPALAPEADTDTEESD